MQWVHADLGQLNLTCQSRQCEPLLVVRAHRQPTTGAPARLSRERLAKAQEQLISLPLALYLGMLKARFRGLRGSGCGLANGVCLLQAGELLLVQTPFAATVVLELRWGRRCWVRGRV